MRKLARACVAGLLLALTSTFSIGSAQAAEEVSVISGVMQGPMGEPMAGVELSATGPDGFTADLTSAVDGSWSFEISIAGEYFVTIDPTTLPSGVALTEPDKLTKQVIVFMIGSPTPTVKFLTGDGPERDPMWQTAMQLTLDGIILGITISLAAVGLSLIFGTTGLTNFAHGELITLGGLTTFFFNKMGLHVVLAAIISLAICALIGGYVQDKLLWKPLRRRGTGLIAMLVVSIGFGLLVRYVFLYIFGGDKEQFLQYAGQAGWQFGPFSLTPKALVGLSIGVLLIGLTTAWLLKSKLGKASRAVADNPALAAASGIDVERVINVVWILGAVLAGYAGVMMGLNQGVQFIMGSDTLLLIFAAVTLGGLGTAFGAIVGSMIVGLFIQLSTLIIPTELKYVGALAVLIIILLVRPQGIMGRKERIG